MTKEEALPYIEKRLKIFTDPNVFQGASPCTKLAYIQKSSLSYMGKFMDHDWH